MRYLGESGFSHDEPQRLGVLLVNLGTPDAPTPGALRRYLAEFLWDPRVVELPRALWWLILHGAILRFRPRRSAAAYRRVWTEHGSPLLTHSLDQLHALRRILPERLHGQVAISLGMRYGRPSIREALTELKEQNVRRLLVLPLYPQYSGSTTGSTFDAVTTELQGWRWIPETRFINQYHDDPAYIAALAASVREFRHKHGQGQRLLFSFHGLPRRYLDAGDPYHCQCLKTARLVAADLGLGENDWKVSFQSRVGTEEWLRPYTDETVREWGGEGLRRVDVICPGFSADCLETLEEIAMQNAEFFAEAGGGELRYIPALNDRPDHIRLLADLIVGHAGGWPEAEPVREKLTAI
jgi:ferrochelatase